jgi:hypothetical protein
MGRACSTTGGEEDRIQDVFRKKQKERDHWEDEDLGGWIILRSRRDRIGLCGLDWSGPGLGPVEGGFLSTR